MKTGASVLLILLLACSLRAQVVIDSLSVPYPTGDLQVGAEGELFLLPDGIDTLCHSTDGGKSWSIVTLPRIWERSVPSYVLSVMPGGGALLVFKEWNASQDTMMLGLLLTRDAGLHWTVDRCPASDRLPPGSDGLIYAGDSICFTSIAGDHLRSEDFGRIWTDVPALAGMQQLRFVGEGLGWAFRSTDTVSIIARTTDRGDTWTHDTLGVEMTWLITEYDGTVLARIHDTIPPRTFYYLNLQEKKWKEISYPFVTDLDGRTMEWQSMHALSQGRFLAVANIDYMVSSLFLSDDGGAHWTRLPNFCEPPSAAWRPIDWRIRDLRRIGPTEYLLRESSGVSLATLTLPLPPQLTASAENFSTTRRRQLLLRWSDPFDGQVRTTEIERSGADSSWLMIANSPIPEQQYLDSTWRSGNPVRYRVTLQSHDGRIAQAVSDSVTPMLGAYVDYLDHLLPTTDKELRYNAVDIRGRPIPARRDTTFTTVTLRYLPPWDSTALLRIHPVRKIVDSSNGLSDTTYSRMVEYRSHWHHFESDSVYPGLDFSLMQYSDTHTLSSDGPRHPGMMNAKLFSPIAWMHPDSLTIRTTKNSSTSDWYCQYRVKEGIGVIFLSYTEDGHYDYIDHRVWTLIEHVNDADEPPLPATGIALASYPNPVTDGATMRYDLPASSEITLTVHDMLGRRVAVLAEGRRGAGTHHAVFHPAGLPSGSYLLRLLADGGAATRLISLIR
jgi:photosystem II stability/assembly factor-like uncharacterized protein